MGVLNEGSTYSWTPGDDKMIRVSKSTLDSYSNWCQQQLWLSKVCPQEEQTHDYLTIGSNVHDRTEQYYINGADSPEVIQDAIDNAHLGNDKKCYELLRSLFPDAEGEYADREQDNQDWMVRNDVRRLKHCVKPEDFLPVANEIDLDAIVEVEVEGYGKQQIHLRGIIDRVFKTEDGVALMELKTGKWNTYKLPQMKGEMAYYAYVLDVSDNDLGPVTHWGWRFPKADHWDILEAKKVSITAMKKRLAKLVKSYLEEDFATVPKGEEYKCGFCDYMSFCPKYTPYANPIEVANGAEAIYLEGDVQ